MSAFWETLRSLRKTHDTLVSESQTQRMTGKRGKEKEEAKVKEEKREMRSRTPGSFQNRVCCLLVSCTVTYKREKLSLPNIFKNVTTIFIILILSCLSLLYSGKLYQLVWPMCKT